MPAPILRGMWKTLHPNIRVRIVTSFLSRLVGGAVALSGLYDLEPLRQTPFLQADLRLTPALVRRLAWSPPRPASVDGVAAALREGNARPWQVTLAAPLLAEAFAPLPEPDPESEPE